MIAIIDYNAGNTRSIKNALDRQGQQALVTSDADIITQADKVIFPGVGEAGSAMKYLRELNLDLAIKSLTQPFLGICLGLQLMCLYSEEGDTTGLGIYDTEVRKFPPTRLVPHIDGFKRTPFQRNTRKYRPVFCTQLLCRAIHSDDGYMLLYFPLQCCPAER